MLSKKLVKISSNTTTITKIIKIVNRDITKKIKKENIYSQILMKEYKDKLNRNSTNLIKKYYDNMIRNL